MMKNVFILNIHLIYRERKNRQCTNLFKLTDIDHRFPHPKLPRRCVLRRSCMNQELLQDGHLSVVLCTSKVLNKYLMIFHANRPILEQDMT